MVPAGTAADRYPRRTIGIIAHTLIASAAGGLAMVSWSDGPTWTIYACLAVVGVGRALSSPSVNTILPQLLPPAEFANANAWLASTYQLASITGPAAGGLLIAATGGATVPFIAAMCGQLLFAIVLSTMPRVAPSSAQHRGAQDIFAGFRFVRANKLFLSAITLDLFAVLFGGAVALLPIFAKDILHVGPAGLGWLRAAPGIGAMTMALVTTRRHPWRRPGVAMLWTVAGFGIATIAFGLSRSFALSMECLFLYGVFGIMRVDRMWSRFL